MAARPPLATAVVLIAGTGLAFATGMVLFVAFHFGPACYRPGALGLSRLAWQNLHRLGAVLALAALLVHVVDNRRAIAQRSLRVLRGKAMRHDTHELTFYVATAVLTLTGFVVWLAVAGSIPLLGPAPLVPIAPARHPWIEVHHLVGLVGLVLTTNHVRRRWSTLGVLLRRARGGEASPWPWARPHATRYIAVDSRLCQACWECLQACPQAVLGKVEVLWHRHVRVERADACTGCRKCLRTCPHGALTALARPAGRAGPRNRLGAVASPVDETSTP